MLPAIHGKNNMKNIYVILIILIILTGVLFFFGMGKKAEAPVSTSDIMENGVISNNMPTIDTPDTKEALAIKEFVVTGQNFSFEPAMIKVKKGDRVKITFQNTEGFHDFRIDEYGVAAKQAKSPATEVLEFTADQAGSFEYYCSVGTHRSMGMKGTLVVEE